MVAAKYWMTSDNKPKFGDEKTVDDVDYQAVN